jgi:hypothetical protein
MIAPYGPFARVRVSCVRFDPPRVYFDGRHQRTADHGVLIDTEFVASEKLDWLTRDSPIRMPELT